MPSYLFIIVIVVVFGGLMWWQSRKAKQQQDEVKNFRESLAPGTEIITIGGVIGKVISVDTKYEEIVIDSEGSLMRFTFRAISKEYTRPAYVDDEDVDENGDPITQGDSDEAQVPIESIESKPADAKDTQIPADDLSGEDVKRTDEDAAAQGKTTQNKAE